MNPLIEVWNSLVNYTLNYFGMGNESTYNQNLDIDFYRVIFDNVLADLYLRKRLTESFLDDAFRTLIRNIVAGRAESFALSGIKGE